jgi:hypothetical protein
MSATQTQAPELAVVADLKHDLAAWNQICLCADMLHVSREQFLHDFVVYAVQHDLMLEYVRRGGR